MKRIRILGLSFVAAIAVGAVMSASASAALPEWGKCVKTPVEVNGKLRTTGKYADANCTQKLEKATGEYEFLKGTSGVANLQFTAVQTTEKAVLQTAQGIAVECTSTVAKGSLSGTKEVSGVEVTFKGCKLPLLSFTCEGFFEQEYPNKFVYKEGEIVTRGLKGTLGYISGKGGPSPSVGLSLTPAEKQGLFAEFVCGTENSGVGIVVVRVGAKERKGGGDSIISPITPVNQMGTVLTQTYSEKQIENPETHELETEQGHQEPENFEGKGKDVLESEASTAFGTLGWSQAGQVETLQTTLNSGEELEVKA
jgi:hypothetical protein